MLWDEISLPVCCFGFALLIGWNYLSKLILNLGMILLHGSRYTTLPSTPVGFCFAFRIFAAPSCMF